MKRAAIYLRVSTSSKSRQGDRHTFDQDPAVQEAPLLQLIAQRGWQLYRLYSDRISGSKEKRPGLDELMADARRGLFDVVVVWRFDRFARSIRQLVNALHEFKQLGIDFVSHQEAVDTSTAIGNVLFVVIAAMAELERSVIRERVIAGIENARRKGTKSGRGIGRPRAIFDRYQVEQLRKEGLSLRQIAARLAIGEGTVRRILCAGTNPLQARQNPSKEDV
jgi:DNA invertase Pin-like site-specific DNA recombinase